MLQSFIKLGFVLSAVVSTNVSALSYQDTKNIIALKQRYMITSPQTATALTLTEQAFSFECGLVLNFDHLQRLSTTPGFKSVESAVVKQNGVIGLSQVKTLMKNELNRYHCTR